MKTTWHSEQQPPHNLDSAQRQEDKAVFWNADAEHAVIGSVLIDSECLSEIKFLKPDDFFDERCRWVFEVMLKLGVKSDEITVADELARARKLEAVGGCTFLCQLVTVVPTSFHCRFYAEIVKDYSERRQTIQQAGRLAKTAYDGKYIKRKLKEIEV